MRKVILAMVLILPFVFQSCKDDDDPISLAGTEWVLKITEDGVTAETHLKFLNATQIQTRYYQDGVESGEPDSGTYTVSGSKIVLIYSDGVTYSGTISGNKITLVFDEDPTEQFIFVKK
jgi:hypothetical protein